MFTTESVTAGHPDKLCDLISDTLLDTALTKNPNAHTAFETLATPGRITIAGETNTTIPIDTAVNTALRHAGYNPNQFTIDNHTTTQSPDIAQGVTTGGAGDQGIMFGYATTGPNYLPPHLTNTHALAQAIHENTPTELGPDGKTQLTINPQGEITTALVSIQHPTTWTQHDVRAAVTPIVDATLTLPKAHNYRLLINPTGTFTIGGPNADTGLTGRKIIIDTYGGYARHGGGAFSGKDPSKVDRSAAYAARQAAISLIANDYATECEVQLAYAIGIPEPVSIHVNTHGTGDNTTAEQALANIDFTPNGITNRLNLRTPTYAKTATYGHFGHPEFPWEHPLNL